MARYIAFDPETSRHVVVAPQTVHTRANATWFPSGRSIAINKVLIDDRNITLWTDSPTLAPPIVLTAPQELAQLTVRDSYVYRDVRRTLEFAHTTIQASTPPKESYRRVAAHLYVAIVCAYIDSCIPTCNVALWLELLPLLRHAAALVNVSQPTHSYMQTAQTIVSSVLDRAQADPEFWAYIVDTNYPLDMAVDATGYHTKYDMVEVQYRYTGTP